jgi:hypothetical protein
MQVKLLFVKLHILLVIFFFRKQIAGRTAKLESPHFAYRRSRWTETYFKHNTGNRPVYIVDCNLTVISCLTFDSHLCDNKSSLVRYPWHTCQGSAIVLLHRQPFHRTIHPPVLQHLISHITVTGFVRTVAMFVASDEDAVSELQAFEDATQGTNSRGELPTMRCPGFEPDCTEVLFCCVEFNRLSYFQI